MAQFEQKPNTGSIFKNDTKGNEKAPAYKGKINVEGKLYEIACWVREKENGEKFFSAKIQDAKEVAKTGYKPTKEKTFTDTEDTLPF